MIESEFKKLAEKEKCEYKVKNFVVDGSIGSKLPISIYTINLLYTDIVLEITNILSSSTIKTGFGKFDVEKDVSKYASFSIICSIIIIIKL